MTRDQVTALIAAIFFAQLNMPEDVIRGLTVTRAQAIETARTLLDECDAGLLPYGPESVDLDPDVLDWCVGVQHPQAPAGGFLQAVADAALRADSGNYPLLRPFLLKMMKKYPQYF